MKVDAYEVLVADLLETAKKVRDGKRPVYTVGDDDVLKNFKSTGEDLEITPEKACWLYMRKHLDAVKDYVIHPERRGLDPEPIKGRFADLINYLTLLYSILEEEPVRLVGHVLPNGQIGYYPIAIHDADGTPGRVWLVPDEFVKDIQV